MNHSEEIISILREEITNYDDRTRRAETGTVLEIGDGIATVYGLDRAVYGELLEFDTGAKGIVLNLERDTVGVVLLGSERGYTKAPPSREPAALLMFQSAMPSSAAL